MSYTFLQKLFGEVKEGEQPKAMTYEELEAAIDAEEGLQLINLKDGGYVPKEKLDSKIAELSGVKKQLEDASKEIKSYQDMDIDGIKKAASDWEEKYKTDTAALNEQMQKQAYEFAVRDAANGLNFTSNAAKKQFIADVVEKNLPLENDKLLGFEDYVTAYKESDPGTFVVEKEPEEPTEPTVPKAKPKFSSTPAKQTVQNPGGQRFSLTEMMRKANEGASIDSLF